MSSSCSSSVVVTPSFSLRTYLSKLFVTTPQSQLLEKRALSAYNIESQKNEKGNEESECLFLKLPLDLIENEILSHLSISQILKLKKICLAFYHIFNGERCWEKIYRSKWGKSNFLLELF